MDDTMHLARCALTPPTMQHNKYKLVPTTKPKKVAIIGGGIGGMECALVLKKRGHKPVIFEKTDTLGGLFITAASMSFKENDRELIEWYKREIEKTGVECASTPRSTTSARWAALTRSSSPPAPCRARCPSPASASA